MLEYLDLQSGDIDEMSELYEKYLNAGENIKAWISEGMNGPGYCGVKCVDGNKMIGVFSARPAVEFTCGHEDIVDLICERWRGLLLYTGDMLVVAPEYRRQGVARELTERLHRSLVQKGCQCFVAEEWHRFVEKDVPADDVLKYLGRKVIVGRYDDFYKNLGMHGLTCPECGTSCCCGAIVSVFEFV